MAAGFTWRETSPADVPDIHRLLHALAVYEKIEHEFTVTPEQLRQALFGDRPLAEAMLANVDGRPVAVCLWYRIFSSFAGKASLWIEDIFVEPAHRRQGIAKAAFRLVAQRALDEGCASIGWNVLDWNSPAIAAYRAMGAEGLDEWTDQRVSGPALVALAGKG